MNYQPMSKAKPADTLFFHNLAAMAEAREKGFYINQTVLHGGQPRRIIGTSEPDLMVVFEPLVDAEPSAP